MRITVIGRLSAVLAYWAWYGICVYMSDERTPKQKRVVPCTPGLNLVPLPTHTTSHTTQLDTGPR